MSRKPVRAVLFALPVAIAAFLAVAPAVAAQQDGEITIVMKNGVVSPDRVEIPAGKVTTITVRNAGDKAAEFESKGLHIEKVVARGRSIKVILRRPAAGEYPFVDDFNQGLATAHGVIVAR